ILACPVGCGMGAMGAMGGTGGKCFRAGTPVWGVGRVRSAIEAVRLGQRVATWLAGESGLTASLAKSDTPIDPRSWRRVVLRREAEGNWCEAEFLRPLSWLAESGVAKVGDWAVLELPEMGVEGEFAVTAIE